MSWSSSWRDRLLELTLDPSQLGAGRTLARKARPRLELEPGSVTARFVDKRVDATATVALARLDDATWAELIARVANRPAVAAAVLTGDLPFELDGLLGVPNERDRSQLLPGASEISFTCSCESWDEPCQHVWAVLFALTDVIERDPNVLLLLRRRSRQELVEPLRLARGLVASAGPVSHQPRGADLGVEGEPRRHPEPAPRPLPTPWRPARPPILPLAPPLDSGIDLADLAELVADGAARALALLNGEATSGLHQSIDVDLVRRAASSPERSGHLAATGGIRPEDLERRAVAWRLGGERALRVHDERWEADDEVLAAGQEALPGARRAGNTLTVGHRQLRVDQQGGWWRFDADEHLGWLATAGPFDEPADALD